MAGLDEMTRYARSLAACKRLTNQKEFTRSAVVMLYLSLPDEVETAAAALCAWQMGKTVVVPKVLWEHRRIMPVEITSLETGMAVGKHGVPDPVEFNPVPLDLIETRTFGSRVVYERYGRAGDESG